MTRGRPMKCPYCGSKTKPKGYRQTATMGKRRIHICKSCKRRFTARKNAAALARSTKPAQPNTQQP